MPQKLEQFRVARVFGDGDRRRRNPGGGLRAGVEGHADRAAGGVEGELGDTNEAARRPHVVIRLDGAAARQQFGTDVPGC